MVKEIRIYIEGGGDSEETKTLLRQGFSSFFNPIIKIVRSKKIGWKIIMCGSRNAGSRCFSSLRSLVYNIEGDSLQK